MKLFPYKKVQFRCELNPEAVKELLSKLVSKPDWNVNIEKLFNNRILEGKVSSTKFTIVLGRYGLTYGKTSLLPIMKGKIKKHGTQGSEIHITIRPLKAGIFILCFFYFLVGLGLYFSIAKNLPQVLIVCCIFLIITYFSLIAKFNKEAEVYEGIIEKYLRPTSIK